MSLRTFVRGVGKTCISAGTLILLFVAFQLWGTGFAESQAQHSLKQQFKAATAATVPSPTTTVVARPTTTDLPPLPPPPTGSAVAIIDIPKIGVDAAVVEGVGVGDLQKGPGHYPGSPLPGQVGNAAIAGHRTTYGAPFYRLNELVAGDSILVTTKDSPRPWHYVVASSQSVSPSDIAVLDPTAAAELTLTTCTPRFTATQRLVVVAKLVGAVDPRPPAPPAVAGVSGTGVAEVQGGDTPVASLSGKSTSRTPAVLWGVACAAIWALAWAVGHRWRRWGAYLIATPVFLVCLFFFFQSFARFLPANV
ncbi:MAG TPA: class E sortase [Acidimicrobiales bacterium]